MDSGIESVVGLAVQDRIDAHLLAVLIDIEASAGLAAQVTGGHHLPQQVRGTVLGVAQVDVE